MYTILNKTKNKISYAGGCWPEELLETLLNRGDEVMVISSYSNTVKIPYKVKLNGITEWEWKSYPIKTQNI